MEELFTKYSLTEIILFIFVFFTSLKGFFTLWDYFYDKIKKHFKEETEEEQDKIDIAKHLADISAQIENINAQHTLDRQELIKKIDETNATISVLLASDKDDIKSWITEKHHYFCYESKCIDYQSLDCIEKRYAHYKNERGNSFVEDLMRDIRRLPKTSSLNK